jgi:hypothetical protein
MAMNRMPGSCRDADMGASSMCSLYQIVDVLTATLHRAPQVIITGALEEFDQKDRRRTRDVTGGGGRSGPGRPAERAAEPVAPDWLF